jgi:choline dehydrogenase-like flavoprotein
MPGGSLPVSPNLVRGAYGTRLKEEARRYYGAAVSFACRGEMIPNEHSYAELDLDVKDKWGIPVVRWHWRWSDHELNMGAHVVKTFGSIIEAMGGVVTSDTTKIRPGGKTKHEVGGAMMGNTPAKSVCNKWNQTWDVKNLFVNDGSSFASNADKNPTLTIMALAWRTADYIIEQSKKGNL